MSCYMHVFRINFLYLPCSAQLSMFRMERRSENTLIIIIVVVVIIIIIIIVSSCHSIARPHHPVQAVIM